MKILQIGSFLWPNTPGGAEVSAYEIQQGLADAGYTFEGLSSWINNKTKIAGVTYLKTSRLDTADVSLPLFRKYFFYIQEYLDVLTAITVYRRAKSGRYAGIILHSWRGLGVWLPAACMLTGLPTVIVLHDFAFVCVSKGAQKGGVDCPKQCARCRVGCFANTALARRLETTQVVVPSRSHGESVDELVGVRVPSIVIHNPNQNHMIARERRPNGKLTFAYFGRLEPDKGFGTVLRLAEEFSGLANFAVAGAGSMRDAAADAHDRGLLRYAGHLTLEQMPGAFDGVDVLFVPSRWRENFPGVCVQALGAGVPVLGSDIGGIPEIVADGETGVLLPMEDYSAWRAATAALIAEPEKVAEMSRNSLRRSALFEPQANREKYRALFAKMLGTMAT